MPNFNNGQGYSLELKFPFDPARKKPKITVEMIPYGGNIGYVQGILDTGTEQTILSFKTAYALGIKKPHKNCIGGKPCFCRTSTGKRIKYYLHLVRVTVRDNQGQCCPPFYLCPGFAKKVKSDLFGMDWTIFFCLAFDHQSAYLLSP